MLIVKECSINEAKSTLRVPQSETSWYLIATQLIEEKSVQKPPSRDVIGEFERVAAFKPLANNPILRETDRQPALGAISIRDAQDTVY